MPTELEEPKTIVRRKVYQEESRLRLKGRKLADRWAKWIVAAGGFAIIASILAILIFILTQIAPLFESAEVSLLNSFPAKNLQVEEEAPPVALGLDENQEIGYLVSNQGRVQFFDVPGISARESFSLHNFQSQEITFAWQALDGRELVFGTTEGNALKMSIDFNVKFFEGKRSYQPAVSSHLSFLVDPKGEPLVDLAFAGSVDESMAVAAITADNRVTLFLRKQEESLFADAEMDSAQFEVEQVWSGKPMSIALDSGIRNLYVGTDQGKIYHWNVSFEEAPKFVSVAKASPGHVVTELRFLIGDRTLMVGDSGGGVSAWFLVRDNTATSGWRLTRIRDMKPHTGAITAISSSARGKGFIAGDKQGNLSLQFTTSERSLADFSVENNAPVDLICFSPKANGALILDASGTLSHWKIDNQHPEAGVKAFFGKVWYEGYEKPEYVWQSTGGSDDFEPKLSLVPLLFGSFKGTLYALVIAIPLAILGAVFTSQFMHPGLRAKIKPVVEIMAALPSVVLGFLAGLWLAPRIEGIVPALLSMAVVLPLAILASSMVWRIIPLKITGRFRPGVETFFLLPIVILGVWFCIELNGWLENLLFAGDFKSWLYESAGLSYDQRNALVVGIAMGFAVIPIIYTISEDALSNVPQNLISGSLALGATRWQTALRVVVPTAAAGIFSAIMIGLGRAVGETMIVLMATGNTPIMDWNIFNGFRTLSANIAVEIPEAPVGGTLYRVLFLAAMLLFMITFAVNTLAELVRQRLREKYQKL